MTADRISLTLPAKGEYARAVRMTATALASRMGMTYDEVDDVRMAAEEAFVYAVDSLSPTDDVVFTFSVGEEVLEIEVVLGGSVTDTEDEVDRASLSTFILGSVCDRYEFSSDEDGIRTLTIAKRTGMPDAG
ncbi:MAG: ATP-binding protein [Coriobacteriia bacterium]|nr:ATP-binding protein [Coriobacteriia bacterium]